jgi:hypothetical protein
MFSEPLLAHAAEISGVHATWQSHPGDDDDRDQHNDDAENEQLSATGRAGTSRWTSPWLRVHSGIAQFNAGAYTGNMHLY